jgi:hypothetical protein
MRERWFKNHYYNQLKNKRLHLKIFSWKPSKPKELERLLLAFELNNFSFPEEK